MNSEQHQLTQTEPTAKASEGRVNEVNEAVNELHSGDVMVASPAPGEVCCHATDTLSADGHLTLPLSKWHIGQRAKCSVCDSPVLLCSSPDQV